MEKIFLRKILLLVLAIAFSLSACGKSKDPQATPDANSEAPGNEAEQTDAPAPDSSATASISDYFAVKSNTCYIYESPTHADLRQECFVTYTEGSRIQRRVAAPKMSSTEIIEYKDGTLTLIYGEPVFYFFENLLDVEPNMSFVILKEPLQVGQTWKPDEYSDVEITSMSTRIDTPVGSYDCMEVSTSYVDGRLQKEYYAPLVGLVKTTYTNAEATVLEYSLMEVVEGAALDVYTSFYKPGTEPEERSVQIITNADLAAIFNTEFHAPFSDGTQSLPESVTLDKLVVDRSENCVYMDFSSDLSALDNELDILKALSDTLGNFFDTAKAKPLEHGGEYSSDNVTYGAEDFIEVDLKSASALNFE
ncbi:MAG: hypothetical protein LBC41_11320 [Clostridiales bacterium]|nr:hypothetical protein [Clostridiales bacterium]